MNLITPDTMKTLVIGVGSGLIIGGMGHLLGSYAGGTTGRILGKNVPETNPQKKEQWINSFISTGSNIGSWTGRIIAAGIAASNPVAQSTIIGISILDAANNSKPSPMKKVMTVAAGGLLAYTIAKAIRI